MSYYKQQLDQYKENETSMQMYQQAEETERELRENIVAL